MMDKGTILEIELTPQQINIIDQLLEIGLYGLSREDVVNRLVSERIRQVIVEGWTAVENMPPLVKDEHDGQE